MSSLILFLSIDFVSCSCVINTSFFLSTTIVYLQIVLSLAVTVIVIVFFPSNSVSGLYISTLASLSVGVAVIFNDVTSFVTFSLYTYLC